MILLIVQCSTSNIINHINHVAGRPGAAGGPRPRRPAHVRSTTSAAARIVRRPVAHARPRRHAPARDLGRGRWRGVAGVRIRDRSHRPAGSRHTRRGCAQWQCLRSYRGGERRGMGGVVLVAVGGWRGGGGGRGGGGSDGGNGRASRQIAQRRRLVSLERMPKKLLSSILRYVNTPKAMPQSAKTDSTSGIFEETVDITSRPVCTGPRSAQGVHVGVKMRGSRIGDGLRRGTHSAHPRGCSTSKQRVPWSRRPAGSRTRSHSALARQALS